MAKAKTKLDTKLAEHYPEHGKYVGPVMEQVLIKTREDGTKVYMMHTIDRAHRLFPDGTKVYEDDRTNWIMPTAGSRKPKRRDIHTMIDKEIFKAIDSLKHAKKRIVIRTVREALTDEEGLPKNVGSAVSRRITHLLEGRYLELEKQTKTRTVLVKGKYKYVGQ